MQEYDNAESNQIPGNNDSDDNLPLSELAKKLNINKFVWKAVVTNNIAPEDFIQEVGPTNIPDKTKLPVEVFSLLFPDTLYEHFAFHTYLYATQESTKSGKPFTPTNINEIKMFLP